MSSKDFDYLIIGAGIVGLALAYKLRRRFPKSRIGVIDKEPGIAMHASGRNSGVLHAGFYYSADSLKAKLCVAGNAQLRDFFRAKNLPLHECGKLVVAANEAEVGQLEELARRGEKNGAGTTLIDEAAARQIEPAIHTTRIALWSPRTATGDPKALAQALYADLAESGISFFFSTRFLAPEVNGCATSDGHFNAGLVINSAGLYADKIAHAYGTGLEYVIVPFKGLYIKYTKNKTDIRTNIYPVPNLKYPFLGVHFTVTHDRTIKIGPTAIPAFWRENYQGFQGFSLSEFIDIALRESDLFVSNAFNFRALAFEEMKKYRKAYMIRLAQAMVPTIDPNGFGPYAPPGIRAQLVHRKTKELVQDFVVKRGENSVHVLNAVSPGWTCSLPFADYIIDNFITGSQD